MAAVEAEAKQEAIEEPSAASSINFSEYSHRLVSFLARNFYTLKYAALILAFCINFMLLFYQVNFQIISSLPIYNISMIYISMSVIIEITFVYIIY
jgi:hypothetical protein